MAKEKSVPKPELVPIPDEKPDEKPVEVKKPVNPTTGESEDKEWRENVVRKLDSLAAATKALGKAVQEWGMEKAPPPKPDDTSDPEDKPEPLDEWSH